MKVPINNIGGSIVKLNDTYKLIDNNFLNDLVLSSTNLNPKKETRGHSHNKQEEIYFIHKGKGLMVLDDKEIPIESGDIILIPAGVFHKVINTTNNPLYFVCVFAGESQRD